MCDFSSIFYAVNPKIFSHATGLLRLSIIIVYKNLDKPRARKGAPVERLRYCLNPYNFHNFALMRIMPQS